ncbi:mannosyl-3-phosphoglycerate synthase [Synoicihabitans lomoniglobus]|uniref:Mannosyl-3-phosphoglycerate synthase n=1 Tax=Synoicihabitans lomoniglobus TaxID=2909285 RepID=A0AAF0CPS7_9BACT|nr:mannosyl-3-phosphoglycerate synthase [Opitutaceae bacterium LMO-M01]WED65812.1 mannosyl-3-phosphoglycerate synthase [Opitutaceae bacterium LMO-M01]
MRIESPREFERLGAVRIYGLQKVYELDAGPDSATQEEEDSVVRRVSSEAINSIERQMAIVVPVRNERLKLIEGVLVGIPHDCLVIVVSNSPREPVDKFYLEQEAIKNYCRFTRKQVVVVHQKDPGIAAAFAAAGYTEILDDKDLVRNGKAEGMIMGTILAKLMGRKYVGFVDSDNYFPGAVNEYVKEYAAGFHINQSDYSMVRISWHSKPKVVENSLYFAKWGRSSRHSNMFLNRLVGHHTGFETEIVKTGNAGEHALTVELAMGIDYATGYAVETFHYVHLLEKYGAILGEGDDASAPASDMHHKVKISQIESRNPHLHESKGDEHVEDMIAASLSTIYHSRLCPESLREEIEQDLQRRHYLKEGDQLAPMRVYKSLDRMDFNVFGDKASAVIKVSGQTHTTVAPGATASAPAAASTSSSSA